MLLLYAKLELPCMPRYRSHTEMEGLLLQALTNCIATMMEDGYCCTQYKYRVLCYASAYLVDCTQRTATEHRGISLYGGGEPQPLVADL